KVLVQTITFKVSKTSSGDSDEVTGEEKVNLFGSENLKSRVTEMILEMIEPRHKSSSQAFTSSLTKFEIIISQENKIQTKIHKTIICRPMKRGEKIQNEIIIALRPITHNISSPAMKENVLRKEILSCYNT
ncbi:hypothetical protein L9F63_014475, partial [Diploptera punctata]